jgi:NADP-dependent 3-hydroxy acid dehydrogenase YdfG
MYRLLIHLSATSIDIYLQVAPSEFMTLLDSSKVYLLVGSLGGLGRSIAQWMILRGARKFVFLQRSGGDKPGVKEWLSRIEQQGSSVTVVRGDVTVLADVKTSVEACEALGGPLGGVVQAAMGLHEDLFSRMTSEGWHTSVQPKWAGTWNLHNAIDGHDSELDFFLMTSSMSGSVGSATESNYCAANSFLDSFAAWRRSQGKPATSLALGMVSDVGYLHDNPQIQAILLRRGNQPLSEKLVLQLIDMAIGSQSVAQWAGLGKQAPAHILTGLETKAIQKLFQQGYEPATKILDDPRCAILSAALESNLRKARKSGPNGAGGVARDLDTDIEWLKDLPEVVATTLRNEAKNATSLREAILEALRRRFSHLLLTPVEQIDPTRSFAQYGIDSMIAADFRSWVWTSLKVDVPFLDLLSPRKSLDSLAEGVEEELTRNTSVETVGNGAVANS